MMDNDDLFSEDKDYVKQVEEASYFDKVRDCLSFIGYRLVDTCQNCIFQDRGNCTVMKQFNGIVYETSLIGKCKHFKKDKIK